MRRALRIAGCSAGILITILLGVVAWIHLRYPRAAPPAQLAAASEADIARGRYLFEHVLACHDCHSKRDFRFYAGPVIAGTAGGGSWVEDEVVPTFSANITPFALHGWSDGEILRAMTAGVRADGGPVHPLMPWDSYANLSAGDARAVVAYLRTLPPVNSSPQRARAISPKEFLIVRVIGRVLPKPWVPPPAVPETDRVAYGQHLVKVAECSLCHGADFSGGRAVNIPGTGRSVVSANITPDPTTGIGAWNEDNFVSVFRSFAAVSKEPVPAAGKNTPMPWLRYASMNEDDLRAIYAYLRTLPPVTKAEDGSAAP
jgi:mono/diheme cytochrome c family protein